MIVFFGLLLALLFIAGLFEVTFTMTIGLALIGLTYGPLNTFVSGLSPKAFA